MRDEQGVHRTTLADVAEHADVPLGNVYYYYYYYYYYKTKDELIGAVLACYQEEAAALIQAFERQRSPQARLKALVQSWAAMRETVHATAARWARCAPSYTRLRAAAIARQPR